MTNINETSISKSDINAVFKDAETRSTAAPGFANIFRQRQVPITVDDLHARWKAAGFPDDTRDIIAILKQSGFGDPEIKKVFADVFKQEVDHETSELSSPAMEKLAAHIKDNNLTHEVINFLKGEFGEELGVIKPSIGKRLTNYAKQFMNEDVQAVFTQIVKETPTGIIESIKASEMESLGRTKKYHSVDESMLSDTIKADQYIKLLKHLRTDISPGVDATRIKNKIIQSWKRGMKSRKHYGGLLNQIHINIHDLI